MLTLAVAVAIGFAADHLARVLAGVVLLFLLFAYRAALATSAVLAREVSSGTLDLLRSAPIGASHWVTTWVRRVIPQLWAEVVGVAVLVGAAHTRIGGDLLTFPKPGFTCGCNAAVPVWSLDWFHVWLWTLLLFLAPVLGAYIGLACGGWSPFGYLLDFTVVTFVTAGAAIYLRVSPLTWGAVCASAYCYVLIVHCRALAIRYLDPFAVVTSPLQPKAFADTWAGTKTISPHAFEA